MAGELDAREGMTLPNPWERVQSGLYFFGVCFWRVKKLMETGIFKQREVKKKVVLFLGYVVLLIYRAVEIEKFLLFFIFFFQSYQSFSSHLCNTIYFSKFDDVTSSRTFIGMRN